MVFLQILDFIQAHIIRLYLEIFEVSLMFIYNIVELCPYLFLILV